MRTLGIDLAADPKRTGGCEVDWAAGTVRLLPRPVTDDALVAAALAADRIGIDAPLGWPDGFVAAIAAHHQGEDWPVMGTEPPEDRVRLRFRRTDEALRADGPWPMSVSTDLIGVVALRAARLQQRLRDAGIEVDRSGLTGRVAETYPAASLRAWGLPSRGYKGRGGAAACSELAAEVGAACGPLAEAVAGALHACDDHSFDAFVCALLARAVALGRTIGPPPDQLDVARREGWIHIPAPRTTVEAIVAP